MSVFYVYRPSRKFQDACTHWQCECCLSWPPSFLMLVLLLSKLFSIWAFFWFFLFVSLLPSFMGFHIRNSCEAIPNCRILMSLLKTLMGCITFLLSCNKNLCLFVIYYISCSFTIIYGLTVWWKLFLQWVEFTNVNICGSHISRCQGWWLVRLTFFQCC